MSNRTTMDANSAVDVIVSTVKNSNLNFFIQESPFSLQINIRKTFIKNKDGRILQPTFEQYVKIGNLEQENSSLKDLAKQLKAELFETRDSLHRLENEKTEEALIDMNKSSREMENFKRQNSELQSEIETLKREKDVAIKNTKSQEQEINVLEEKNDCLTENLKGVETQIEYLKVENLKIVKERNDLENENLKLKDVLYGCPECGMYSCECDDAENEDDNYDCTLQPSELSDSPPAENQTEPSSGFCPASPWTPPPTPPCEGCGGINFGPSPGSLCFLCIPPLEIKPPPDSSPSHTPPGTPPSTQHRLGTASSKNMHITMASS